MSDRAIHGRDVQGANLPAPLIWAGRAVDGGGVPDHPAPAFAPKPLSAQDLAVPVTPGLRKFPRAEREALIAAERAQEERLNGWTPRTKRRVLHWVVGSVFLLPLLNLFITQLTVGTLWMQIPVAALWGFLMAWRRPRPLASGFLLLGTGALTELLGGVAPLSAGLLFLIQISALMTWFCLGFALGSTLQLSRMDGA